MADVMRLALSIGLLLLYVAPYEGVSTCRIPCQLLGETLNLVRRTKRKGKTSLGLSVLACKMGTILVAPNRVIMRLSFDHGFVQLI